MTQWPVPHSGAPAHPLPPGDRLRGVGGLAVHLLVELEDRVAPQDQGAHRCVLGGLGAGQPGRHRLALRAGEHQRDVLGGELAVLAARLGHHGVLVHVGDQDVGRDTRTAQRLEPGRRG